MSIVSQILKNSDMTIYFFVIQSKSFFLTYNPVDLKIIFAQAYTNLTKQYSKKIASIMVIIFYSMEAS